MEKDIYDADNHICRNTMTTMETYKVRAIVDLVSWVSRDPERALDTGVKLIAFGSVIAILAALMRE